MFSVLSHWWVQGKTVGAASALDSWKWSWGKNDRGVGDDKEVNQGNGSITFASLLSLLGLGVFSSSQLGSLLQISES